LAARSAASHCCCCCLFFFVHLPALATAGLAALAAGLTGLFRIEFVRVAALMGGPAAFAGNLALLLAIHGSETPLIAAALRLPALTLLILILVCHLRAFEFAGIGRRLAKRKRRASCFLLLAGENADLFLSRRFDAVLHSAKKTYVKKSFHALTGTGPAGHRPSLH
jgi:hypothetical protein